MELLENAKLLELGLLIADIALGAATIVLGFVTLIVGILAFWGYYQIKEASKNNAEKIAKEMIEQFLKKEDIKEMIREEAARQGSSLYLEISDSLNHKNKTGEENDE